MKTYKMRSLAARGGDNSIVDLHLEFEGKRAFAVWDSITLGKYQLKARLEIDPKLLTPVVEEQAFDFLYQGELVLPRPQDN